VKTKAAVPPYSKTSTALTIGQYYYYKYY